MIRGDDWPAWALDFIGLSFDDPLHAPAQVESFGFQFDGIRAIEPLGFLEFL